MLEDINIISLHFFLWSGALSSIYRWVSMIKNESIDLFNRTDLPTLTFSGLPSQLCQRLRGTLCKCRLQSVRIAQHGFALSHHSVEHIRLFARRSSSSSPVRVSMLPAGGIGRLWLLRDSALLCCATSQVGRTQPARLDCHLRHHNHLDDSHGCRNMSRRYTCCEFVEQTRHQLRHDSSLGNFGLGHRLLSIIVHQPIMQMAASHSGTLHDNRIAFN